MQCNLHFYQNINGHSKRIFAYSNEYIDFSLWNIIKLSYIVFFANLWWQKDTKGFENVTDFCFKQYNRFYFRIWKSYPQRRFHITQFLFNQDLMTSKWNYMKVTQMSLIRKVFYRWFIHHPINMFELCYSIVCVFS